MKFGLLAAVCLASFFVRCSAAQTAPASRAARPATAPALSDIQIDAIVKQLSNDDFRVRQSAQERLVKLGEDARPIVAELLARMEQTQARAGLQTVLGQIDENRTTGASIVSIDVKDAAPADVFAELSRQCYAQLRPSPENLWDTGVWPPVTLHIDHEPFWAAMQKIAGQTNIDLQSTNDGLRIMRAATRLSGPSVLQGPFLVVASQISRSQNIMLAPGGAARSDFSVQLLVYSEPKIQVLDHSPTVEVDEASDDQGNNLLPDASDVRPYYGGGGGIWNLHAALHFPDHPGKHITTLRGNTWFLIQTASQRLEIPDILKAKQTSRVMGGLPVMVGEMKKVGPLYEFQVSVSRDPSDPRWVQLQRFITQHLHVYDAAGELMPQRRMSSRSSGAQMEFTISLAASGTPSDEPARLIWDVPTATRAVNVPFEFKGLPMPR